MNLLWHLFIVLFLTLAMTLFWAGLPLCNLLIIYVVFLAVASPGFFFGLLGVIFAGTIHEGMSASSSGVFVLSFFWLFCIVRYLRRFVHQSSLVFAILAVLAGLVLENFFVLVFFFFRETRGEIWPLAGKVLAFESLSALFFTPLLFGVLRVLEPYLFSPKKTDMVTLILRSSSKLK